MRSKLAIYGSVLLIATALLGGAEAGCSCSVGSSSSWSGADWIDSTLSGSSPEPLPSNGSAAETVDEGNLLYGNDTAVRRGSKRSPLMVATGKGRL